MAEERQDKMELVEVKSDDILAERRALYDRFMSATTYGVVGTVVILVLMWIFLV